MPDPSQFVDPQNIMFVKMIVAMLLGGIIGTERAVLARQAAGTRTFGLVSLGACMFVITASYVNSAYLGRVNFDPMHVTGAIITGIGFIGGGLIVFHREALRGVTTAAGLWIAAAVGIAVGFGLYSVGVFATILALIMFTGMWYVENRFKHWFVEFNAIHHLDTTNSYQTSQSHTVSHQDHLL